MSSTKKGKRLAIAKGVRFTCKQCADCCKSFPVSLTEAEAERYDARDWTPILGVPGPAYRVIRGTSGLPARYLRRRSDGACIFLAEDNLCKIHGHYGEHDKPLVCRIFPYTFVPGDTAPTAGAFFTCTSVASGDGELLAGRRKTLEKQLRELEALQPVTGKQGDLPFFGPVWYPRVELDFLLDLIRAEFENQDAPFSNRVLAVSEFLTLIRNSNMASLSKGSAKKQVTSFAEGTRAQVERGLLRPPVGGAPLPQRLLFRLILGFACRRDPIDILSRGFFRRTVHRFGNLLAGITYLAGTGTLTPLGRTKRVILGEVRRQAPTADPMAPIADGALTRYFVGQLSSRAVFNPQFELRAFLPAIGLLLRQYPMIMLFARAACRSREGETLERDDYTSAIRSADRNFGRISWDRGLVGPLRGALLTDFSASLALVPWCAVRPGQADP